MNRCRAFTLIELLVVIAIIALLMSILMPALSRVKDQAKAVVCINNLHQFALVWKIYLDDNGNKFPDDMHESLFATEEYWKDPDILLCPYASKPKAPVSDDIRGGPHHAWGDVYNNEVLICSYGLNQYCSSDPDGGRTWDELVPNATISFADRVPLMGDAARDTSTPQERDEPPEFDGQVYYSDPANINEIRSFCINRHNFHINMLFLDWSVRPVGLKELWTIKWHKVWSIPPDRLPVDWDDPGHWMYTLPDPLPPVPDL